MGFNLKPTEKYEKRPDIGLKTEEDDPFEGITEQQLLVWRSLIEEKLPVKFLKDISLEHEMVLQYRKVCLLQESVLQNDEIPPNQRAQVVNSCASALESLVKMQERYHHSERLKQIEVKLIELLNRLPPELTQEFFGWYTEAGEAL